MENAAVRAPTRVLTTVVEKANRDGIKVGDTWINYGRTFKGEPLTSEAAGREVTVTLVQSKDGKEYVRSIDTVAAASPEALAYAEDLAHKREVSSEEVERLCQIAFKKEFNALTLEETSRLIEFLGGYKRSGKR